MKKIIIITAIMLLAVTAFGQRSSRERARPETQNHKSEATARRSAERTPQAKKAQTTHEVRRATTASSKRTTNMNRSQPVNTNRKPTGKARTSNNKGNQKPTGTVRTNNGNGRQKPTSTVRTNNGSSRQKPTGTVRTYQGKGNQKPTGTVRTNNGKGNQKPTGTVRTNNGNGRQKPSGKVGTYKGNGKSHAENRRQYTTPNRKPVRQAHAVHTHYTPVKYRKVHHHYKVPNRVNIVWTRNMYREYRLMYPDYRYWYYPTGYRIVTVPYYNANFHIGEVRNVYGRIHEVWYSWATDEYYLYFGSSYPYQDFTVILEGRDARRFSRHPEAYFGGRYIWVTGLVSHFEGKPEIMVRRRSQIHLY